MTSTDISGEPILILGLADVKILFGLLAPTETPDQDKVMDRIVQFINDPNVLEWEKKRVEDG